MKAILYRRYGGPDVLALEDIPTPVPKDDEVLIRVRAASVNPLDWQYMRGRPSLLRLASGLRRPKDPRLGADVAGQVTTVGQSVSVLKAGDEVFGTCRGSFAEYVCAKEAALVKKPVNMSFEQAAATPIGAFSALQALRDKGRLRPGQSVLINGAGGGVGTFAVQIATVLGGEVTGVCSTLKVEPVRSLGARRVIDYTREDFTSGGQRYDLIIDCVGSHSVSACRRVLNREGAYVGVGGPDRGSMSVLAGLLTTLAHSAVVSQRMCVFLARSNSQDLSFVRDLVASGKVTPLIDRRFALTAVPEAVSYLEQGHALGKVVIEVAGENAI